MQIQSAPRCPLCCTPASVYRITKPPSKVSIVRFKKSGGVYRKQSSFNISSEKQARQIVEVIEKWYAEVGPQQAAATGGEGEGETHTEPEE